MGKILLDGEDSLITILFISFPEVVGFLVLPIDGATSWTINMRRRDRQESFLSILAFVEMVLENDLCCLSRMN